MRVGAWCLVVVPLMPVPAGSAPGPRIGIVDFQAAIARTHEGQQLIEAARVETGKREEALRKSQSEIETLQRRLTDAGPLLNQQSKDELVREIAQKRRQFDRLGEDATAEATERQREIMQKVGTPLRERIADYAREHGYTLVLDSSSPAASLLWSSGAAELTAAIVQFFDTAQAAAAQPKSSTARP